MSKTPSFLIIKKSLTKHKLAYYIIVQHKNIYFWKSQELFLVLEK